MSFMKKAVAVMISAAMVAQSVVPVMADVTETDKNSYYYVAIGDSATAGYNLETLSAAERNRQPYMVYTYKSAVKDAYPTVVGKGLSDALVEEGYIADASGFDFSNLGTIAFRTSDFYKVLEDEDHISELMRPTYENNYKALYEEFKADPESFKEKTKVNTRNQLKELLDNYANDYGNANLKSSLTNAGMTWNSEEEFRKFYDTNCADEETFAKWFDGVFDNYYVNTYIPQVRGDLYKYHNVFVNEYSKADMISVNAGSNDLLLNLMFKLRDEATSRQNPVMYIIYRALADLVLGGNEVTVYLNMQANIARYRNYTKLSHIQEAQQILSEENLDILLESYTDEAIEAYPQVIEAIKKINHEAGKNAQFVYVSTYYPYADVPEASAVEEVKEAAVNSGLYYEPDLETEEGFEALKEAMEAAYGQEYMELPEYEDNFSMDAEIEEVAGEAGAEEDEAAAASLGADPTEQDLVNEFYDNLKIEDMVNQVGVVSNKCLTRYNQMIKEYAEADNAPYIDIYDVSDETNYDPHPLSKTHKKIADRILAGVVMNIETTVSGKGTLTGPSKCVYGHDVEYTATPAEDYLIKSVTVDGEEKAANSEEAVSFAIENVTGKVAVDAVFERIPGDVPVYTITFETNGGSEIESVEGKEGEMIPLYDKEPTRSGYTFAGWYTDAEFTQEVASVTLEGDITVYAKWNQNSSASLLGRIFSRIFNRYSDIFNPGSSDPGTSDPGTSDPGTSEPGTGGRLTLRTIFERMGLLRPRTSTDTGTGDSGTGNPGTGESGTGESGEGTPSTGSIVGRMIGNVIWRLFR